MAKFWAQGACLATACFLVACQGLPNGNAPNRPRASAAAAKPAPGMVRLATRQVSAGLALSLQGQVRLIANDGSGLIANDGLGLIANDGSGLIANDGAGLIANDGAGLIANDGLGVVSNRGTGLIANDGAGIVSNHTTGLLANDGAGLIANDGAGLIANDGAGLIANDGSGLIANDGAGFAPQGLLGAPRFALAQADRVATGYRRESRLREAQVVLVDLAGRVIVKADGQPLAVMTDAEGNFRIEGQVPQGEAIFARVALPDGGLLRAIVLPGQGGLRRVDTASSLGSAYLLDEMLVGKRQLLAKLPPAELARLDQAASAARVRLGAELPTYGLDESVALARRLKQQDGAFDRQLENIRALLLAGQSNLGAGLKATEVSLTLPAALWVREDGALEVLERLDRRIRRVGVDGKLSNLSLTGPTTEQPSTVTSAQPDGKGGLWLADENTNRIWHVDAQHRFTTKMGAPGAEGGLPGPALQVKLDTPSNIASDGAGGLYVTETYDGRLIHLKADGQAEAIAPPVAVGAGETLQGLGLAAWPDGSLVWAFQHVRPLAEGESGRPPVLRLAIWPRDAKGQWAPQPWTLPPGLDKAFVAMRGRWLTQADGSVAVARPFLHDVVRLASDGSLRVLAGQTGRAGSAGDGGPATQALLNGPRELAQDAEGRLLVVEQGSGLVRRIEADGQLTRVAGSNSGGALVEGQGGVAINGPGGMALDGAGQVLFTEAAGGLVQRLVQGQAQPFAGTQPGFAGDGGLATQAQFDGPVAVAHDPKTGRTFVLDAQNKRVRVIEADGRVRTVAGGGKRVMDGPANTVPMPGPDWQPQHTQAIAIDPQGRPVIADANSNVIVRLEPLGDEPYGLVVPIAGLGGKGKPQSTDQPDQAATATSLAVPTAIAFDPQGRLVIGEAGAFVIRRIEADGKLVRVAGPKWSSVVPQLLAGTNLVDAEGVQALDARFLAISSLTIDPQGRIVVGETGTSRLQDLVNNAGLSLVRIGGQVGARIRRIEADGRVVTLGGEGGRFLKEPEGDQSLRWPSGLLFDREGRLVVADFLRNQLRLVPKAALNP